MNRIFIQAFFVLLMLTALVTSASAQLYLQAPQTVSDTTPGNFELTVFDAPTGGASSSVGVYSLVPPGTLTYTFGDHFDMQGNNITGTTAYQYNVGGNSGVHYIFNATSVTATDTGVNFDLSLVLNNVAANNIEINASGGAINLAGSIDTSVATVNTDNGNYDSPGIVLNATSGAGPGEEGDVIIGGYLNTYCTNTYRDARAGGVAINAARDVTITGNGTYAIDVGADHPQQAIQGGQAYTGVIDISAGRDILIGADILANPVGDDGLNVQAMTFNAVGDMTLNGNINTSISQIYDIPAVGVDLDITVNTLTITGDIDASFTRSVGNNNANHITGADIDIIAGAVDIGGIVNVGVDLTNVGWVAGIYAADVNISATSGDMNIGGIDGHMVSTRYHNSGTPPLDAANVELSISGGGDMNIGDIDVHAEVNANQNNYFNAGDVNIYANDGNVNIGEINAYILKLSDGTTFIMGGGSVTIQGDAIGNASTSNFTVEKVDNSTIYQAGTANIVSRTQGSITLATTENFTVNSGIVGAAISNANSNNCNGSQLTIDAGVLTIVAGGIDVHAERNSGNTGNTVGGTATITVHSADITGGINTSATDNAGTGIGTGGDILIGSTAASSGLIRIAGAIDADGAAGSEGALSISASGGGAMNGSISLEQLDFALVNTTTKIILNAASGVSIDDLNGAIDVATAASYFDETDLSTNIYYKQSTVSGISGDSVIGASGFSLIQFDPATATEYFFIGSGTGNIDIWNNTGFWFVQPPATTEYVSAGLPNIAALDPTKPVILNTNTYWGRNPDGTYLVADDAIANAISGTGGFYVDANAGITVTLTGNNTYTGGTSILGGTLAIGSANAWAGGNLTVEGTGTFDGGGNTINVGLLNGTGTGTVQNATLSVGTANIGDAASFTGTIATPVVKNGASTQTFDTATLQDVDVTAGSVTLTDTTFSTAATVTAGATADTLVLGGTTTLGAGSLTLDLDSAVNFSFAPGSSFAATGYDITLGGSQYYSTALVKSSLFNSQNLSINSLQLQPGESITNLNKLTIAPGGSLVLRILPTESNAKVIAPGGIDLDPADCTVQLIGIVDPTEFLVFETPTGVTKSGTPWQPADFDTLVTQTEFILPTLDLEYRMDGNFLKGYLTDRTLVEFPGLPESDALEQIYNGTPHTGSPTAAFQNELRTARTAGATDAQLDQMTQQFTPALAASASSVAARVNSMILTTVGSQIKVPWRDGNGQRQVLRAQNAYAASDPSIGYAVSTGYYDPMLSNRDKGDIWCQMFGYGGRQATKNGYIGYDTFGGGFATGAHRASRSKTWLVGASYAYTKNELTSEQPFAASTIPNTAQIDTHSCILYAVTKLGSRAFLAGKVGGTWGDIRGTRIPDAANPEVVTYATNSFTGFGQVTAGWNCYSYYDFSLTPKTKFTVFNYGQSGYTENWQSNRPMTVSDFSNSYCAFDLLLDFTYHQRGNIALNGSIGYQQLLGARGALLNCHADGLSYIVNGIVPAEGIFVCDLGGTWNISERCSLQLEGNIRLANEGSELYGGAGTLVYAF